MYIVDNFVCYVKPFLPDVKMYLSKKIDMIKVITSSLNLEEAIQYGEKLNVMQANFTK